MSKFEEFLKKRNISYRKDSSIKDSLTIRIGGKVKYLITIRNYENFRDLLFKLYSMKMKFIVLGGGSNTIFPDDYLDITVIVNKTASLIKYNDNILKVNTGISNSSFLKYCKENSISGFEFLSGIPGTIGGATAVNAGAFGRSISDKIEKGEIFTASGEIRIEDRDYFGFRYRDSKFKYGKDVLLNIYLRYSYGDKKRIEDEIEEIFRLRRSKHPPYTDYSAGCFFKNPVKNGKKISAGKLIEESSLRGYTENNLKISEYHSNFVINRGNSTFSEIRKIEEKIKKRVKSSSGISLEREVIFISPQGDKY